jgi:cell division protein FtsB
MHVHCSFYNCAALLSCIKIRIELPSILSFIVLQSYRTLLQVLKKTGDYISQMQQKIAKHQEEIQDLKNQNTQLEVKNFCLSE